MERDFGGVDEFKAATGFWFGDQADDFYFKGINIKLLKSWRTRFVEVKWNYVEN